jgi:hypothetical protein
MCLLSNAKTITWGDGLQCKDANSPALQSHVVIMPHFPQVVSPTPSPDPFLNCHICDAILNWQMMTSVQEIFLSDTIPQQYSNRFVAELHMFALHIFNDNFGSFTLITIQLHPNVHFQNLFSAFDELYYLERACMTQLLAMGAAGREAIKILPADVQVSLQSAG